MFANNFFLSRTSSRFILRLVILCALWIFGLITGFYFVSVLPVSVFHVIRSPLDEPLTLIGLVLIQIFPFLVSAIIYLLAKPVFVLPVVFLKALSFAYCTFGIVMAYGDAGWMMRLLVLFSDSFTIVLLLWFWIRNFTGRGVLIYCDLLICLFAVILICVFDFYVIYPLLLRLSDIL